MSDALMQMNSEILPEKELPNLKHYEDDLSFIDEDSTPESIEKRYKEMQQSMLPGYVRVRSMEEIYDTVYIKRDPIVEGLVEGGTIILGGASKVGKSFLSLQLAYCVSQGLPFLGFKTNKTGVIYFALEDVESRLQKRMQTMFGLEPVSNLYFATEAGYIRNGFEDQLQTAIQSYPSVGLVIIDVMQKVRDPKEQASYNTDYNFVGSLKKLADQMGICMILVHHTRKALDPDVFNMVSGSMGITAAVDGTMVLYRQKREDECATLSIVGRDVEDRRLLLERDKGNAQWKLVYEEQIEISFKPKDEILSSVSHLLSKDHPLWMGTAEELVYDSSVDLKPNALSRYLRSHVMELKKDYYIQFYAGRTREARCIKLYYDPPAEEISESGTTSF